MEKKTGKMTKCLDEVLQRSQFICFSIIKQVSIKKGCPKNEQPYY